MSSLKKSSYEGIIQGIRQNSNQCDPLIELFRNSPSVVKYNHINLIFLDDNKYHNLTIIFPMTSNRQRYKKAYILTTMLLIQLNYFNPPKGLCEAEPEWGLFDSFHFIVSR